MGSIQSSISNAVSDIDNNLKALHDFYVLQIDFSKKLEVKLEHVSNLITSGECFVSDIQKTQVAFQRPVQVSFIDYSLDLNDNHPLCVPSTTSWI